MSSKQIKILITDKFHIQLEENLLKRGFVVTVKDKINIEELQDVINEYHGLVIRSRFIINKDLIEKGDNLQFIARGGSGVENIDVEYANSRNIRVISSPEANCLAVAEHVIAFIYSIAKNLIVSPGQVKSGKWQRESNWGTQVQGRALGIIGYGHVGSSLAQLALGLGMKINVYDKYKHGFGTSNINEVALDELLTKSDIVSIHITGDEKNAGFFNRSLISKISSPVVLINTSRGNIVSTKDLLWGLSNDHFSYIALDVLEQESHNFESMHFKNKEFRNLVDNERVIITPHVAGWTNDSYEGHASVLYEKIVQLFGRGLM